MDAASSRRRWAAVRNRAATAGKRISAGFCRYASGRFAETALQHHRGNSPRHFPLSMCGARHRNQRRNAAMIVRKGSVSRHERDVRIWASLRSIFARARVTLSSSVCKRSRSAVMRLRAVCRLSHVVFRDSILNWKLSRDSTLRNSAMVSFRGVCLSFGAGWPSSPSEK